MAPHVWHEGAEQCQRDSITKKATKNMAHKIVRKTVNPTANETAKKIANKTAKKTAFRFSSARIAREQRIARRLLAGESATSVGRRFGLTENEIESLERRLDVDLRFEAEGSIAIRRRQTLQLEGLCELALGAWR